MDVPDAMGLMAFYPQIKWVHIAAVGCRRYGFQRSRPLTGLLSESQLLQHGRLTIANP